MATHAHKQRRRKQKAKKTQTEGWGIVNRLKTGVLTSHQEMFLGGRLNGTQKIIQSIFTSKNADYPYNNDADSCPWREDKPERVQSGTNSSKSLDKWSEKYYQLASGEASKAATLTPLCTQNRFSHSVNKEIHWRRISPRARGNSIRYYERALTVNSRRLRQTFTSQQAATDSDESPSSHSGAMRRKKTPHRGSSNQCNYVIGVWTRYTL